jgi:hypothetical protein
MHSSEKESQYERTLMVDSNRLKNDDCLDVLEGARSEFNVDLHSPHHKFSRTKESIGAAITVAMVATAVGFACCENLVYIFLYNGSSATNGKRVFLVIYLLSLFVD